MAAARTCEIAGFHKIVGFDMGGTSTDVAFYAGEYEVGAPHRANTTNVVSRATYSITQSCPQHSAYVFRSALSRLRWLEFGCELR